MSKLPFSKLECTFIASKINCKFLTSRICGTVSNLTGVSANIAAGISATVEFFAPPIVTSPWRRLPPRIIILAMNFP